MADAKVIKASAEFMREEVRRASLRVDETREAYERALKYMARMEVSAELAELREFGA